MVLTVFIVGTVLHFAVGDGGWPVFWKYYIIVLSSIAIFVSAWLTIGGVRDLKNLIKDLKSAKRDDTDDGTVSAGHNTGDDSNYKLSKDKSSESDQVSSNL